MGAVSLSDFKKYFKHEGDVAEVILISPSTMDSADTVDLTDLLNGRSLVDAQAFDQTTGDVVTITVNMSTDVATIDASGSTTDHTYSVHVWMK